MGNRVVVAVAAGFLLAGCSSATETSTEPSVPEAVPIFGTADTTCESAFISSDGDQADEALLEEAVDCLLTEIAAGNPVTVDIDIQTIEGDSIFYRYAFDGETILIVRDDRADEFGNNEINARRCEELSPTFQLPEGVDCQGEAHDGFPEAVS